MGDPHPEDMIQRMLDELVATSRVTVDDITTAHKGWSAAATELREIAKLLSGESTQSLSRQAAWVGTASDSATAAFDELALQFQKHADGLDGVALALESGEQEVLVVAQRIATDIGTKLKAKPKGGLFGTGIGPSVGPDVVEFVDDVADGVGAVAKNPVAIVNKGLLIGSPLAALAVAGDTAEHQELSRADQMNAIKELHDGLSFGMSTHGSDLVSAASEGTGAATDDRYYTGKEFGDSSGQFGAGGGTPAGSSHNLRASSTGDPRLGPFASSSQSHPAIGDTMPSLSERVTADGGMSTGSSGSGVDLSPDRQSTLSPGGPGSGPGGGGAGGGLSGGGGAAAGAGASAAGIGGGLAGALGGAKAAGAGGLGATSGMLGGSSGAAGKSGGMGMMGQGMGGGAGAGGGGKDRGKRYGDGPELGPRRRRGAKHAVMGAGARGDGQGDDSAGPDADDPFYDE